MGRAAALREQNLSILLSILEDYQTALSTLPDGIEEEVIGHLKCKEEFLRNLYNHCAG